TEVSRGFDAYGMVSTESSTGDTAKPGDEQCVTTTYARNTGANILTPVSRVETVAVACGAAVSRPADVIDDTRTSYDGGTFGAAPTRAMVTRTERINGKGDGYDVVTSVPSTCGADAKQLCLDVYGRTLASADVYGKVTTTSYTPATGEVPVSSVVTNPRGQAVTTTVEPLRGQTTQTSDANGKVTTTAYDPLGRTTKVWLPTRSAATYPDSPNYAFDYLVRKDGPAVTTTKTLAHDSTYRTAYTFQDGLLRTRQTQEPSPDGAGRLVTETFYDTRGQAWRSSGRFFATGAAEPVLVTGQDLNYPASADTEFDGAGRVTAVVNKRFGDEVSRITTTYTGDTKTVVPPQGGTVVTTVEDALGRPVTQRQYTSADRTTSQATSFGYDKRGRLSQVEDPSGAVWKFTYDVRGRQVQVDDPDKGTSKYTYDQGDRLTDLTDARLVTLHTDYDELGRKTAVKKGSTLLATWTYDTATNGKGLVGKSVRWVNGQPYETAITSYNSFYQPVLQQVTIPAAEGLLAGTYKWTNSYNLNTGQVMWTMQPAVGGLPAEKVANTYQAGSGLLNTVGAGSDPIVSANTYDHYGRNTRREYGAFAQHLWESKEYDEHTGLLGRSYLDREVAPQRVEDVKYSYDAVGNVTSIASAFGQDAGRTTDTQCFALDALRRITEAWTNTGTTCAAAPSASVVGGPDAYWTSYTYDAVGNRKTETRHKTPSGPTADTVRTYAAPAAGTHNLPKVTQTGTSPHEAVFTYDAAGNTRTRQIGTATPQTLTYDDEGHLASVAQGANTSSYVYDSEGGRLIRKDSTGTTLYLPGGNEVRLNKAGTAVTGTRYYKMGGETVALRTGGKLTFVFSDRHGTGTTQISADAAQTVTRRKTGIFGDERGPQPTGWLGEKGFVGGTKDADTGLTHLGAREYDPAIGRFVSVDPIMNPADAQQMQAYAYGNNNPVTQSDPSGLYGAWCVTLACVEGTGGTDTAPTSSWEQIKKDTSTQANQRTKDNSSSDRTLRSTHTSKPLAKKQREVRVKQIMAGKFWLGRMIDKIDDANERACRMTPGPEKAGCQFNRMANRDGVSLFGLEYGGMEGQVEKLLERIDESWLSRDSEEVDGVRMGFNNDEFEIALRLAYEGKEVVAQGSNTGVGGGRNAKAFDAWVDGVRSEFKAPTSERAIKTRLNKADQQGADAVYLKISNVSREQALYNVKTNVWKNPSNLTMVRAFGGEDTEPWFTVERRFED
ncbi:RHS repeat-associated core domain-containing protein, partial [Streptomyces termitum]